MLFDFQKKKISKSQNLKISKSQNLKISLQVFNPTNTMSSRYFMSFLVVIYHCMVITHFILYINTI